MAGSSTVHDTTGQADWNAHQPMLAPHQPSLAAEHREIDQLDLGPFLHPGCSSAAGAGPLSATHLDVHPERTVIVIDDTQHDHIRQSDQQLAHARRVHFHRGSPDLDGFDTIKFAELLLRTGDGYTLLISEVPFNASVLPADEAGLHCGIRWVNAEMENVIVQCSRPTRPGSIAA